VGEARITGPWSRGDIAAFFENAIIPIRVASNGADGPLVQSLWFHFDGQALWCATQSTARLAKRISRDNRVGFEVAGDEPPYRGVRGTGIAELLPERAGAILPHLIDRYQGDTPTPLSNWLLSRLDSELAIRIEPLTLHSWDYRERMKR
jgi:nitroimidazol reductase NimA-like FMN-containing flavoprotein (pyridoxamine 5'-phosphate oxidase superfamily)